MAQKHEGRVLKIVGESPYGSHKSMVKEYLDNGMVVCEDERGLYTTFIERLDNGLADPKRYSRYEAEAAGG